MADESGGAPATGGSGLTIEAIVAVDSPREFRIHPRDDSADLLRRARQEVADLDGVTVEWAEQPRDASSISSTTSTSYALIAALSRDMLPDAPVAPGDKS